MSNPYGGEVQEGVYAYMVDTCVDIERAIKEGVKETLQRFANSEACNKVIGVVLMPGGHVVHQIRCQLPTHKDGDHVGCISWSE